ncbi:hypothetical protein T4D_13158 [Trichinella pseudospiralis]|uniref:Uncharacterized protein n=1 Tax=Trichinella pseudospiralis TaxID=6337 RepID=A0A0V1FVS1_TRIPS|nr:hypothetical protein T4D_13158 [Trichinella pseudospiralis]
MDFNVKSWNQKIVYGRARSRYKTGTGTATQVFYSDTGTRNKLSCKLHYFYIFTLLFQTHKQLKHRWLFVSRRIYSASTLSYQVSVRAFERKCIAFVSQNPTSYMFPYEVTGNYTRLKRTLAEDRVYLLWISLRQRPRRTLKAQKFCICKFWHSLRANIPEGICKFFYAWRLRPRLCLRQFPRIFEIFRILAPGVPPGYAPGHKKICICLQAMP